MRAVVHTKYGSPDVLQLRDVERPTPKPDEVLIRVVSSTVNRTDCGCRSGKPFMVRYFTGLRRPRRPTLGSEVAGVVEAIGGDVTEFAVGDEVFGVDQTHFGTHAEYVSMRESGPLASKPANMTFDEAAAVCDGVILALMLLRKANPQPGQRVLIYGASGSIGTAAVQLAKQLNVHITAVCGTPNIELVRSLGADEVIDFLSDDFTKQGKTYDVVIDAVGKEKFRRVRRALNQRGAMVETDLGFMWQNVWLAVFTKFGIRKKLLFPIPDYPKSKPDIVYLKELIEGGKYRAVIDRRYPLEDIVEATRYVESEQKVGNVIINVAEFGPIVQDQNSSA
jgi:NADPH:quinone reductase-like Zn-dependent oxidoreductase